MWQVISGCPASHMLFSELGIPLASFLLCSANSISPVMLRHRFTSSRKILSSAPHSPLKPSWLPQQPVKTESWSYGPVYIPCVCLLVCFFLLVQVVSNLATEDSEETPNLRSPRGGQGIYIFTQLDSEAQPGLGAIAYLCICFPTHYQRHSPL